MLKQNGIFVVFENTRPLSERGQELRAKKFYGNNCKMRIIIQ